MAYPAAALIFYAGIFEFVTFDIIPTDRLYDKLFAFENDVPFSDRAKDIGYESRYAIPNSGSMPIFICVMLVVQPLYALITSLAPKNGSIYTFTKTKQEAFKWAGLTDFTSEIYLSMSFCLCINTSAFSFDSRSEVINNVCACIMALFMLIWPLNVTI